MRGSYLWPCHQGACVRQETVLLLKRYIWELAKGKGKGRRYSLQVSLGCKWKRDIGLPWMICRQCVFSPNTFLPRFLDSSSKSLERNKWTYPDLIMLRQQSSQMVEWNLTAPDLRRYITLLEIFFFVLET